MPGYRKTSYRKKTPTKSSKSSYKRSYSSYKRKPTVTTVKKIVKSSIARSEEKKCVQYQSTGSNIYPSNHASFAGSIVPVSPYSSFLSVQQGTNQGTRIGNRISIRSCKLKGTILPAPYNVTTNPNPCPQQVIFWLIYDKTDNTAIPAPTTDFFQQGSTTIGFQNALSDCWQSVNTDKFRVLTKRIFKIGYATSGGTGISVASQSFTNNDFKLNQNFSIDLTKYLIKHVRYNDNNAVPNTRGLFWMFTAVAANGGANASTLIPCTMQYAMDLQYTDA